MRRKLIAMDLDGTAVGADGKLAPGVKKAVLAARAEGHMVAFVTGRADMDMAPLDCEYGFVDYLILNNGAKLIRGCDGAVLGNEVLNKDEVERMIRFCQEENLQVYMVCGMECYASMYSWRLARYMDFIGCSPRYFDQVLQVPTDRVEGMTILGDAAVIMAAIAEREFGLRAVVSEPHCLDLMNPDVNKWNGLETLLRLIGMQREDVIAIGDYDNDLEMISQSGIGVAVANARECVKSGADYVTVRDNEAGAVADMINELVLGRVAGLCIKNAAI